MITQRKHEQVLAAERAYWQGVVADLLDRIQAPERAPFVEQPEPELSKEKPYVSDHPYDDERWDELNGATEEDID